VGSVYRLKSPQPDMATTSNTLNGPRLMQLIINPERSSWTS
jgi:hypothetical protein